MKYMLIGGAGYIGSNVANLLAASKKNQILVYDDLSTGNKKTIAKLGKFVKGSQLDAKKLDATIKAFKPDVIMHFAAKIIVSESVSKPIEYFENNVGGIINIIKSMHQHKIKNLIFSSTAAVYGMPKVIPIDENTTKEPINPYGASKLSCEYLITAAQKAYNINSVIFRYFNVAGASDDFKLGIYNNKTTLLIPRIIMSLFNKDVFHVFGNDYDTKDGSCLRDFIHVVDLAKAHLLAANYLKKNKQSLILNLGTNKGFTVFECLKTAEKILKQKVNYDIQPRRPGDPAVLLTKNDLAYKTLKWKPQKTLEDMILSEYSFRKNLK